MCYRFCWKVGFEPTFYFRLMYKQNPELVKLLKPVINSLGYEMWGLEFLPGKSSSLLRVYIDKEAGISLADCERVSEQVTGVLDVNDPIRGAYQLEISSPGIDRPLFGLEQFERFKGFQVKLKLNSKLNGRRNITGMIEEVNEGSVLIIDDEGSLEVPAEIIEKANIKQVLSGS